jgi:integrase
MPRTKIRDMLNGYYALLVMDQSGKYKQVFKHKKKSLVNKKRSQIQAEAIDAETEILKKEVVSSYKEFAEHKINQANHPRLGLRSKSVRTYFSFWKNYINKSDVLKNLLLKELTATKLDAFFLEYYDSGVSYITCTNIVKTFHTFYKWSVGEKFVSEADAAPILFYKVKDRPTLKPKEIGENKYKKTPMITLDEAKQLLKHLMPKGLDIKDWQKFMVACVFTFTGMRMSELRALRWDRINFITQHITIDQSIVGTELKKSVKAEGSHGDILIHPQLYKVLAIYKQLLTKHYTPMKMPLVFPSLKSIGDTVPICEKTITDWLLLAYDDLGFARVMMVKNKSGDSKHYLKVFENKFEGAVTKTFRHFQSTALINAQAGNPVLDDNFIKHQIRHRDIKTTRKIYADHNDFTQDFEKKQQALSNAVPIELEVSDEK